MAETWEVQKCHYEARLLVTLLRCASHLFVFLFVFIQCFRIICFSSVIAKSARDCIESVDWLG